MKQEIRIPPVGESIREVTIGRFLKQNGQSVVENEEIVELETEKVNQVIYSPGIGTISWSVNEGQIAQVDQVIGYVDSDAAAKLPDANKTQETPKQSLQDQQAVKPIDSKPAEFKPPESKSAAQPEEEKSQASVVRTTVTGKKETRTKMSKLRQVISRRLLESLRTTAMLTTFNEVDMSHIMDLRTRHKEEFLKNHGVKLGMTSFFVQASLEALKAFPMINSYIDGDEIVRREYYDIGVAVSTDKGLVVPVLRDCDKLSFAQIEQGIEAYAAKARNGKLRIDDLEGGGFTISNGGVFGSLLSTPILNPPQVAILGMHKTEKRAVVINDQIVIRPMMYLALSYDHRIVDGKEAIQFLIKVKEILENFTYSE